MRRNFHGLIRFATAAFSLGLICYVYLPSETTTPTFTAAGVSEKEPAATTSTAINLNRGRDLDQVPQVVIETSKSSKWDPVNFVNGPPTESVFDNLRNDTKYITSFLHAGWTNDMMALVNTIYLGILTNRVPMMPPHLPMHVGQAEPFPFGDIFDLPRLRELIRHPVLEWRDVKNPEIDFTDDLGCWTVWDGRNDGPRRSTLDYVIHLDIAWTKVPSHTEMMNQHNNFWGLAKLGFPEGREEALRNEKARPSNWRKHTRPPEDHLMCFDILYYVAAYDPFEWDRDYSPAWRFVGTHLHFHPNMVKLGETYTRKAFELAETDTIPPFISIHLRHGDFQQYCSGKTETCYAPISVVAQSVAEVRRRLHAEKGIVIQRNHVMVTSDEKDPKWWAEIKQQGWSFVDHYAERTGEKLGRWYPAFIDAVIQSMGTGFVGTDGSTMSTVARRRVEDWNDGLGVMVPFGAGKYPTKGPSPT